MKARLKIAIVTHNVIKNDGQGRVNLELTQYLAGCGHEMHLYANMVDCDLLALKNIIYHHIPVFIKRPFLIKSIIFLLRATLKLWRAKYDIVHINGAVSLAPYDFNTCHLCHSAWAHLPEEIKQEKGFNKLYYRVSTWLNARLERKVYSKSKGTIIAVSNMIKRELVTEAKVRHKPIVVIHNGVGLDEFSEGNKPLFRNWVIGEFDLKKDDLTMLFAGDIRTNRKGLDYVLQAIRNMKADGLKLLVAGDKRRSPFPKRVHQNDLLNKVKFIGFRRDLDQIFKGVDIFILPTLYDPFGLINLEAMSSGTPVITSNPSHCGAAELIEDMKNGILLRDSTDAQEIKEKIELLAADKDLRDRLGRNARKVAENYSWTRMAQKYEELYYDYLDSKRP